MKGLILDGYGTLVRIGNRKNPYRYLAMRNGVDRRAAYEYALTHDVAFADLLQHHHVPVEHARCAEQLLALELQSIEPYPEARHFLNQLDKHNVPWRILSNLATPYCEPLLLALGISEDRCLFSCKQGVLKPHANAFELAARSMQLTPAEIMMVGDSIRDDVDGALAAGMAAFHLRRPEQDLFDLPMVFQE